MTDCPNLATCSFFRKYEQDESIQLALQGFVSKYCKGDKQSLCVRKKVSMALGGPDKVPANMMPNGSPLSGTTSDGWSDDVKNVLSEQLSISV